MDVAYIPMARGFSLPGSHGGLVQPQVLTWRLSITMEVDFCLMCGNRRLPSMVGRRF